VSETTVDSSVDSSVNSDAENPDAVVGAEDGADVTFKDVDFYNPNAATGRPSGVYMDDEERKHAEDRRAVVEDREPDYKTMGATAGVPMVTSGELPLSPLGFEVEPDQTLTVAVDPALEAAQEAEVDVRDFKGEANDGSVKDNGNAAPVEEVDDDGTYDNLFPDDKAAEGV
jgi:hypothetical protein